MVNRANNISTTWQKSGPGLIDFVYVISHINFY